MIELEKIIEYTKNNGGCTFNIEGIQELKKGYTISLQKYEYKTSIEKIEDIKKDIQKKLDIIKDKKNLYIGTWIDNNILYIDINKIELNFTRAMEFARIQKQLAIFDNMNKKSIYLKKDTFYILYEYIEEIKDIKYITEFTSKKELIDNIKFYEFRNIKEYIYKQFTKIDKYFIRNGKKYIIIEEVDA